MTTASYDETGTEPMFKRRRPKTNRLSGHSEQCLCQICQRDFLGHAASVVRMVRQIVGDARLSELHKQGRL